MKHSEVMIDGPSITLHYLTQTKIEYPREFHVALRSRDADMDDIFVERYAACTDGNVKLRNIGELEVSVVVTELNASLLKAL